MQVRVLGRKGAAVLVEWVDAQGEAQRVYLPVAAVHETAGGPVADAPEQGIPYGEPWEEDLEGLYVQATPAAIAAALRRQGVWTWDDLRRDPQAVLAAFHEAYGMDAQALREAARRRISKLGE